MLSFIRSLNAKKGREKNIARIEAHRNSGSGNSHNFLARFFLFVLLRYEYSSRYNDSNNAFRDEISTMEASRNKYTFASLHSHFNYRNVKLSKPVLK